MNNKEDIDQLLARYFAGEPLSLVQQKELDTWIAAHRQEFEQIHKLMQAPVRTAEEIHFDADKAWAKIEPRLENRTRAVTFERKMTFFLSVAASLLVLLGIGAFYLFRAPAEEGLYYANADRTVKQIVLPDSSEVILYPEATLSYYFSDKEKGRMTTLKGKAPVRTAEEIHFDADKAWAKIEPRLENRTRAVTFERKMTFFLSVAASLLVLLGIGAFYLFRAPAEEGLYYANADRTVKQIVLPDSSEVILYPEATLSYYFSDKEKGRMTTLKGKAFFQVKKMHGIPFRVKTDFLDVEVLGTSFLVDVAQKEKAGVFVKTGKVRVESAEHEVVIQANEKAELKGSVLKTDTIRRPQDVFGVDDSVLIFEQAPITEVVKVIREKTGIQIDLAEGLEKNLITTRINSNEPDIAGELAFLCGCKCETLVKGKHYRLYEK